MTLKTTNRSLLKRSSTLSSSSTTSSSFAIRWLQLVATTLVIIAALVNLTHGFKPITGEGRKLFGGYRITPKQCRATKTLPSTDPRSKGPTICMFNHECAQRNGEVVGACMDGFLFGACCQVPSNQEPENTLINDAQNAYYHQYQNQKLQQQETETNKIVSQAYETFGENSVQQQSMENSQAQDSAYGGSSLSSTYSINQVDSQQQQSTSEQNSASSSYGSTESILSSTSVEMGSTNAHASIDIQTTKRPPTEQQPPKIHVHKDSVKVSSPSQSPQNDDFVLQVLNTMPPGDKNHRVTFTTELPNKITSSLTQQQSSSEFNSYEEEPSTQVTTKPTVKKPEPTKKQNNKNNNNTKNNSNNNTNNNKNKDSVKIQQTETYQHQNKPQKHPLKQHDHSETLQQQHQQELFGAGVTFTHSDITHPGADADLIEDDLQFSTGYGPQPVFVPAPPKPIQPTYNHQVSNKLTSSHLYDATTSSSSSITTHVDSIETIIQQLNGNNNNPGPSYNIINHHEQQQYAGTNNAVSETTSKRPTIANDQPDNTKHSTSSSSSSPAALPSLSYNEIVQSNDQSSSSTFSNNYGGQMSSSSLAPSAAAVTAANDESPTTVNTVEYADEFVLEDHTVPEINYNDYQANKHPTSDFNKMPAIGIAYPVDITYMEEGANLEVEEQQASNLNTQQKIHQQQQQQQHQDQQQPPQAPQALYGAQSDEQQPQQPQQHHTNPASNYVTSQKDETKLSETQTIQNYMPETHQRPIASYIGVVTSQSYNTQPVPDEVVVSSHTTKVEENAEVSTEYKPIITTNRVTATSHRTTTRPVKITPFTKRPTLVTKRPNNQQKPTKASQQRPTTITTQHYYATTPIETKTPSPPEPVYAKPTVASTYNSQGIQQQQDYIISSGSTPKPIVTRKPTRKQANKTASTSYVTGPTTARPVVTPQFHYGQEEPVVQADDKLDSFVHSTAESLASATPAQESLSYDPPVFISGGSSNIVIHNQRPQFNKKPGFIKVQSATQRPPNPTVLITPKPTTLHTTASTFTTPTLLSGYGGSTSFVYNSLVTRRPDLDENIAAADYMGISTVNSNDFDDPGYYGSADLTKLGQPTYVSGSTESVYPVPSDDKPAFPGYYGPTPTYPAFQVPGEKFDSPLDEQIYTSPNDFINFPPVRNPNLNMSATSSAVTSDLELSTPAFVEDSVLKNKMNTLVHKIVESLQGNFEALAEMIDDNNNTAAAVQTYQASQLAATAVTKKPTRKPATKVTTAKPKATTKKPNTRVSTKAPTKRPAASTTKKPVIRRTTTTKRPNTRKPTRKVTTTTKTPAEDEIVDEEDEEDVNPSENEINENETYSAGASGRKILCGMRPHVKSGRIVGGKGATFGAYPWQVLVRESTWLGLFTKNKCGGVLITNRYVITAAHCQPGFLASLVAVMGEFDISGDLESKRAVTKNVKRVIVHRQYDPATFENDIALLELDSPVQFDTHIVPICMPSDVADFTGRMATVTGWGRLKYGGGVPSVLQEVQVPVIENSVCQEMFNTAGHNKKILNSFLCAGYANGQKDSCEGDSGGPLVLQRPDGRYELAGTVSHGIKCAAPYLPGVYMRTTYYKPWLRSITGVK